MCLYVCGGLSLFYSSFLLLPCLASSFVTQLDPSNINSSTLKHSHIGTFLPMHRHTYIDTYTGQQVAPPLPALLSISPPTPHPTPLINGSNHSSSSTPQQLYNHHNCTAFTHPHTIPIPPPLLLPSNSYRFHLPAGEGL